MNKHTYQHNQLNLQTILTTMVVPSSMDSQAISHRLLLREMGTVIGTLRMCFMCMFELVDVTIYVSICVYTNVHGNGQILELI
jgi:hypothetical protein